MLCVGICIVGRGGVVCDGLWLVVILIRLREEVLFVGRVGDMREM